MNDDLGEWKDLLPSHHVGFKMEKAEGIGILWLFAVLLLYLFTFVLLSLYLPADYI